MRRINVNIEELALTGISGADRNQIAAGLRRELAELFRDRDLPTPLASSRHMRSLVTKPLTLDTHTRPDAVGRSAAKEIWRSFGGAFK